MESFNSIQFNNMKLLVFTVLILISVVTSGQQRFDPAANSTFITDRADKRYVSSRAIAHRLLKNDDPLLKFRCSMDSMEFRAWQAHVYEAMGRLMKHPSLQNLPMPKMVDSWERDGYRVEKWEAYPLPEAVVPYLILIPYGVDASHPAPAILCIPGSGQTKELLAGEPQLFSTDKTFKPSDRAMARLYAKQGYVAVAVDNPGSGETDDLESEAGDHGYDYSTVARSLLELDWSYLGYTSYIDLHILNWMKTQSTMRSDRLIVSGFSLGTEPLMALGILDKSIYAFVYNDFLCTTRERALVMTLPDNNGRRPWPNDISHLIPGFLRLFDFPDLVAALAPRPVICTEGGMDRDFEIVKKAFEIAGAPENFTYYHYKKYQNPANRTYLTKMPEGINRTTFFNLANVDPANHYFKAEYILPWLKKILEE